MFVNLLSSLFLNKYRQFTQIFFLSAKSFADLDFLKKWGGFSKKSRVSAVSAFFAETAFFSARPSKIAFFSARPSKLVYVGAEGESIILTSNALLSCICFIL